MTLALAPAAARAQDDAGRALTAAVDAYAAAPTERWLPNASFVYRDALLGFDVEAHLRREAPGLLPLLGPIRHWSGRYSISPRLVLTLLALEGDTDAPAAAARAFAALSAESDPGARVAAVLARLHDAYYAYLTRFDGDAAAQRNAASFALSTLGEAGPTNGAEERRRRFVATMDRLFPGERAPAPLPRAHPDGAGATDDPLELPWPRGEFRYFNGTHVSSGALHGIQSSIDFTSSWSLVWGDEVAGNTVSAAHEGTVTVFSNCSIRITREDGLSSDYYHLDAIEVDHGAFVSAGTPLSSIAASPEQATCQGGTSSGPHLHFSLLQDGQYRSLDGVELGGYRVHAGRYSYDSDPDYMWLERDGVRSFAYAAPIGAPVADAHEPDDAPDQAGPLLAGEPQERSLHVASDVDWAVFELATRSAITLRLEAAGEADTRLIVHDEALVELARDGEEAGDGSRIDALTLPPGRYLVRVDEDGNDAAVPAYRLLLDAVADTPRFEAPAPGSTLGGPRAEFAWSPGTAPIDQWWLQIGAEAFGREYFDSGALGAAGAVSAAGLPTGGETLVATLWYREGEDPWRSVSAEYTAASLVPPAITWPPPDVPLDGSEQTYSWRAGEAEVAQWWLYLGDRPDAPYWSSWLNSGALEAGQLAHTARDLPTDRSVVHATLWYRLAGGGRWSRVTQSNVAADGSTGVPTALSPDGPGAGAMPEFAWSDLPEAAWYRLWVDEGGGNVLARWYRREEAGCDTERCRVSPGIAFDAAGVWYVRAWSEASGSGRWSRGTDFAP